MANLWQDWSWPHASWLFVFINFQVTAFAFVSVKGPWKEGESERTLRRRKGLFTSNWSGVGDANGKSATSCSLGVTIKSLPCVEQMFSDHSLHSDEVFTQLKMLALCLQKRSCFRLLWHVTLNTSNPILRLTKLVSSLKYFANTLYFHNFYFLSFVW